MRYLRKLLGAVRRRVGGSGDARPPSRASIDAELARHERAARRALPGDDGAALNQAGDVYASAGENPKALGFYGRAIDAYIEAQRFSAAGAVCRKLLRIEPRAVRPRCTLAWIDLAQGFDQDAIRQIGTYVRATGAVQRQLTRQHLEEMGRIAESPAVRDALTAGLIEVGIGGAPMPFEPGVLDDPLLRWSIVSAAVTGEPEVAGREGADGAKDRA